MLGNPSKTEKKIYKVKKGLWNIIGTFFVILGIIGLLLPLLPTTPFLLLATACYAKGSKRFYNWLLNNRFFGNYITNYKKGKGIPIKSKIITIIFLWLTISYSVIFIITIFLGQLILILIAIGVTYHIFTIKTLKKARIR